ncbi:CDF family Co(II)/Ni(II) efflux transporter DmeF [Brevundimonas sp.]|uniref:CDF family Co(II)/Ni(II) efflux transporter DmeF n=1 Tax=Brevundimonas sp. TaxID=1871086 RepID=UPI00185DE51C|nr:CDF family Co(II)/Ni(II) efflux transporter DmeF [Brevundimonas sp.]MBA4806859.1 CDF family Co(II)/Ni(II) efflux transporter DmeF [Brevundimonas sp.]
MTFPPAPAAHDHVFLAANHDENARRTLIVVILTAVMMVGEIVAGVLTGSMALLADGIHMLTHAGALGVAALAYAYARRHAHDRRYSFGTGKVGDLAGFASALVLGLFAIGIGVESVRRLFEPTSVLFGEAAIVAVIGLAVNVVSALLLSGGHHHGHHHGDHDHHHHDHGHGHGGDNNLRSAYLHVLADALTSVLAIIALLSGRYLGWTWLDPIMGLVGAAVIAKWSWGLMRDTAAVLLDRTDEHVAEETREAIETPGDAAIRDLHIWRIGPDAHAAIISVSATGVTLDALRARLVPVHELKHVTIEIETAEALAA